MKEKLFLFFLILTAGATELNGKETCSYPVASIDSTLKKDAWAVCRDYRSEFEIFNYGKAVHRIHKVITVLSEKGEHFGDVVLPYNPSMKISSIAGRSLDAQGKTIEKLKNQSISDFNYTSEGAIYDDLRLKKVVFSHTSYPYTIELDYEVEYNGLINYPEWQPIVAPHYSVEQSFFRISFPDSITVRYREFRLPPDSRTEKRIKGYTYLEWRIQTIPAFPQEPLSPDLKDITPGVVTAPTKFVYEKTKGSMNTWKEYGQWVESLIKGRDLLPSQKQNEIKQLIGYEKDTVQIVRKLYQYMQARTRYVGIQLGIGGFQPFPAETVDKLGYGDCKALSNYMKSLLKVAGIESYYTVAGAGDNNGITLYDFPTNAQTNHILLFVPLRSDTIWLECTSQTAPFGFLGTFTAGKTALQVTSQGGTLVRTPLLTAEQNSQRSTADITISENGGMKSTVEITSCGYQYENVADLLTLSKKEQEKALYKHFAIAGLSISDFSIQARKEKIPQLVEVVNLTAPSFAAKTGTRMFIPLNPFNRSNLNLEKVENRRMPVVKVYAYYDRDSIRIHLPKGYLQESLPKSQNITSEFGRYQTKISMQGDQLLYVRELKTNRGTWPKERYAALVNFYEAIEAADKVKLVLKEIQ